MKTEEILQQLVAIQSYSSHEKKLVDYLMGFAQKYNLPATIQYENVVIHFSGINNTKALIFNTHMDTADCGNTKAWHYPPFGKGSGVVNNGRLYGLGASDAKASIIAFLLLALECIKNKPMVDVFIVFVTREESDGYGSKSFVSYFRKSHANYTETAAIIGEPTYCEVIEIGHRGSIFLKVSTTGDSGHSARPELIQNHAIEDMMRVIAQIKKLEQHVIKRYTDNNLGRPSFTLTGIQGNYGTYNKVVDYCSSMWDVRTTEQLHSKVVPLFKKALRGYNVTIEIINQAGWSITTPDEKIVQLFQTLFPHITTTVSHGSNDSCFFTQKGIPAVVFGAGNKDVIHKENEYVVLRDIPKAVAIYKKIIENF